jgi:hypothetical protein
MRYAHPVASLLMLLAASIAAAATPDLTGVWSIRGDHSALKTDDGRLPPLKPEAKAAYERHVAAAAKGDRSFDGTTYCLPPGLPRLMLIDKPFEILQREKAVYFAHQDNRMPRRAYFGEALPDDPEPFYLGHSVAKWEGETLVIESSGFRDETLLDDAGLPHSKALRLTERYRLSPDGKTLRVQFTIDDAQTFTRPWNATVTYLRREGFEIPEEVCAERMESLHPKKRK